MSVFFGGLRFSFCFLFWIAKFFNKETISAHSPNKIVRKCDLRMSYGIEGSEWDSKKNGSIIC
ncbi:hypothetical protein LEP1GSC193_0505 [Leptospira alstonii serovar Pingchang str. 80-412]|uniref:Uncharacterized protein n=2 Tax=Leptospira alstonii TaxID=28452 RepID=M6CTY1_9LEPT|nr:hypothetical protein LEP1GSC194_2119 [Leptospira alstonii serovar Sichuan str. 79601]EQA79553.1 hypothetical protein LEP1GSC193_0505 [Leptospira alstonii serovar Pingchang str. 80-412]